MKYQITIALYFSLIIIFKNSYCLPKYSHEVDDNSVKIPKPPKPGCECQVCPPGYEERGNECCGGWDSQPPDSHCLPDYYCDSEKDLKRKSKEEHIKPGCKSVAEPAPPPDD